VPLHQRRLTHHVGCPTRERLYVLVWTKPRTQMAREVGVSDVWIGKQCRASNVPMPPRGYCANLPAGTKACAKYRCRRSASDWVESLRFGR
jgi:hypothetical protein